MSYLLFLGLFANQANAFDGAITDIGPEKQDRIEYLLNRHKPTSVRPESCPMQSNKHKDILGKIENIKNLFKDNCTNTDPARLEELLSGATSIQSEINAAQAQTGSNQSTSIPTEVNGQDISSVVNNINGILTTGQCKFKDGSFLENTADVITSFSQMGLLVPNSNGLVISAGGLALSSILRIMHSLFTPLFDFTKTSERQTFIKLNCSFYDIRRDIEASGFMDVSSTHHKDDLDEVKSIVKELEEKLENIDKEKASILTKISKDEAAFIKDKLGTLDALSKIIEKANLIINEKVQDNAGVPANTKKLQVIQELTLLKGELSSLLSAYTESGMSKIPPMDMMLNEELKKLDFSGENLEAYMKLVKEDVNAFNNGFRANLLFHFDRISNDIATSAKDLKKKFNEETLIDGLKVPEYIKALEKETAALTASIGKTHKKLKVIELRLARITKDEAYSSADDGEDNIVSILSSYNEITEQVYGEWGEKFLRYTTESSYEKNKLFEEKFNIFAKQHLIEKEGTFIVPKASDRSELRTLYACQDAEPFRRAWKLANGLSQNGYDFLATNKDLFHSDTAESLMSGIHLKRSDFERIQFHYKSAMFAKKLINKEEVSSKNKEKYLKKRGGHKRYLGMVMLEVNRSKQKAILLQELIERYNCSKVTTEE
ncbi:MAG: hypothetical protein ACJAT2_001599 [Bacteriovoracaceae bacterium]|jgi:hypothetical protein